MSLIPFSYLFILFFSFNLLSSEIPGSCGSKSPFRKFTEKVLTSALTANCPSIMVEGCRQSLTCHKVYKYPMKEDELVDGEFKDNERRVRSSKLNESQRCLRYCRRTCTLEEARKECKGVIIDITNAFPGSGDPRAPATWWEYLERNFGDEDNRTCTVDEYREKIKGCLDRGVDECKDLVLAF